jgi:hypothetical protein
MQMGNPDDEYSSCRSPLRPTAARSRRAELECSYSMADQRTCTCWREMTATDAVPEALLIASWSFMVSTDHRRAVPAEQNGGG